ncbi:MULTISPECIES: alpha-amylase [unclassified Actinomyces]|uniref:alpha-amylase n=1 Tax=unclassified Actinomyces TaxID=2609248 RepID=UPI0020178A5A|nr:MULTISPECIES: alpha-amylase [unclassified Actinomyces]MCL3777796.1 alpha-amylase [Actinomyces sp. AC-20-1]MCL3790818.1 alpha-amylase [Actinomyces sp. 187325]MCL3792696.1 alpha-amylase [Actinomyces sp. 186855]MCL3795559.1 alpha-amylase [Actinomyces sp. 217892]
MPVWMLVLAVITLLVVASWLIGTLIGTRPDRSRAVGDVPMAPEDRRGWLDAVEEAAARHREGTTDLRALHLELAAALRGFASERSGEDLRSATVREILDMADTAGPRSVEERLRLVGCGRRPLDTNPLGYVGELLYVWEQPSFDRDPAAAAEEAVDLARQVVTRW